MPFSRPPPSPTTCTLARSLLPFLPSRRRRPTFPLSLTASPALRGSDYSRRKQSCPPAGCTSMGGGDDASFLARDPREASLERTPTHCSFNPRPSSLISVFFRRAHAGGRKKLIKGVREILTSFPGHAHLFRSSLPDFPPPLLLLPLLPAAPAAGAKVVIAELHRVLAGAEAQLFAGRIRSRLCRSVSPLLVHIEAPPTSFHPR